MTNLRFAPPDLGTVLLFTELPGGSNKIHDRSPYGNIGTITGATWVRLPSGLWVLSYDGTDDHLLFASPFNPGALDFSVELWLKIPTSVKGTTSDNIVFCDRNSTAGGRPYFYWGRNWGANGEMEVYLSDDDSNVVSWNATDGPVIADGIWHRFAIVVQPVRGRVQIFKDGTLFGTKTGTINSVSAATKMTMGDEYYNGVWRGFNLEGLIALPRIGYGALSALEDQNHFNQEKHLFGVW